MLLVKTVMAGDWWEVRTLAGCCLNWKGEVAIPGQCIVRFVDRLDCVGWSEAMGLTLVHSCTTHHPCSCTMPPLEVYLRLVAHL